MDINYDVISYILKYLLFRKAYRVVIVRDIIKILTVFIKSIFKGSKKFKRLCAKFHHCNMCVTDFREPKWPPSSVSSPEKDMVKWYGWIRLKEVVFSIYIMISPSFPKNEANILNSDLYVLILLVLGTRSPAAYWLTKY